MREAIISAVMLAALFAVAIVERAISQKNERLRATRKPQNSELGRAVERITASVNDSARAMGVALLPAVARAAAKIAEFAAAFDQIRYPQIWICASCGRSSTKRVERCACGNERGYE